MDSLHSLLLTPTLHKINQNKTTEIYSSPADQSQEDQVTSPEVALQQRSLETQFWTDRWTKPVDQKHLRYRIEGSPDLDQLWAYNQIFLSPSRESNVLFLCSLHSFCWLKDRWYTIVLALTNKNYYSIVVQVLFVLIPPKNSWFHNLEFNFLLVST